MKRYYETPGSRICKATAGAAEVKFYQRRKTILDVVELLAAADYGGDGQEAASRFELWRTPDLTLNSLGDKLKKMSEQEKRDILRTTM